METETSIVDAFLRGRLDLAQIGGFTDDELAAAQEGARVYLKRGQPAKALRIAGLLVTLRPSDGLTYRIAGIAALQLEQSVLAESLLTAALQLNPGDVLTELCLGEAKLANGDVDGAHRLLSAALPRVSTDLAEHGRRARELLARITVSPQRSRRTA